MSTRRPWPVGPQSLPVGWYVNSKDGKRPVEDAMVKDLVPHSGKGPGSDRPPR